MTGRVIFLNGPFHDRKSVDTLAKLKLDVGLHKAGVIYRDATINAFRFGILNHHIGLLPAYRGRSVLEWSILQGDPVGITVFFIDTGIDTSSPFFDDAGLAAQPQTDACPDQDLDPATPNTNNKVVLCRVYSAGVAPGSIRFVIAVSCTGYMMPSLDVGLSQRLGIDRTARRLPITELGCSAAVAAVGEWRAPIRLNETTGMYFKRLAEIAPREAAARYRDILSLDPKGGEFEKAVKLDPNYIDARFGLMEFYLMAPRLMGGGADKAREQAVEIRKRDVVFVPSVTFHWD